MHQYLFSSSILYYIIYIYIYIYIYINDLEYTSNSFKPVLFSDYTYLIFYDKSITNLKTNIQCNLDKLFYWLNINKLSFNVSKSSLLLFTIRNKNNNLNVMSILMIYKIKQVIHLTFLGIIFNDKLDYKS